MSSIFRYGEEDINNISPDFVDVSYEKNENKSYNGSENLSQVSLVSLTTEDKQMSEGCSKLIPEKVSEMKKAHGSPLPPPPEEVSEEVSEMNKDHSLPPPQLPEKESDEMEKSNDSDRIDEDLNKAKNSDPVVVGVVNKDSASDERAVKRAAPITTPTAETDTKRKKKRFDFKFHEDIEGKKEPKKKDPKQESFVCLSCSKSYKTKSGLAKHSCKDQKNLYVCTYCKKSYKRETYYKKHTEACPNSSSTSNVDVVVKKNVKKQVKSDEPKNAEGSTKNQQEAMAKNSEIIGAMPVPSVGYHDKYVQLQEEYFYFESANVQKKNKICFSDKLVCPVGDIDGIKKFKKSIDADIIKTKTLFKEAKNRSDKETMATLKSQLNYMFIYKKIKLAPLVYTKYKLSSFEERIRRVLNNNPKPSQLNVFTDKEVLAALCSVAPCDPDDATLCYIKNTMLNYLACVLMKVIIFNMDRKTIKLNVQNIVPIMLFENELNYQKQTYQCPDSSKIKKPSTGRLVVIIFRQILNLMNLDDEDEIMTVLCKQFDGSLRCLWLRAVFLSKCTKEFNDIMLSLYLKYIMMASVALNIMKTKNKSIRYCISSAMESCSWFCFKSMGNHEKVSLDHTLSDLRRLYTVGDGNISDINKVKRTGAISQISPLFTLSKTFVEDDDSSDEDTNREGDDDDDDDGSVNDSGANGSNASV